MLSIVVSKSAKPELYNGLLSMSVIARDSRKLFSMFKSFESIYILQSMAQLHSKQKISMNSCDIISHLTKCFYYLFDNVQLLCGFSLLPFNRRYINHLALLFYTGNILCGLWKNVKTLYFLIEKRRAINTNDYDINRSKKFNNDILLCFIDVSAKIGDLLSVFNALGLSKMMFKTKIDSMASIGGIYAGLISLWRTYRKISSEKEKSNANKK